MSDAPISLHGPLRDEPTGAVVEGGLIGLGVSADPNHDRLRVRLEIPLDRPTVQGVDDHGTTRSGRCSQGRERRPIALIVQEAIGVEPEQGCIEGTRTRKVGDAPLEQLEGDPVLDCSGSATIELRGIMIDARHVEALGGESTGDSPITTAGVEEPGPRSARKQREDLVDLRIGSLVGQVPLMEEVVIRGEEGITRLSHVPALGRDTGAPTWGAPASDRSKGR